MNIAEFQVVYGQFYEGIEQCFISTLEHSIEDEQVYKHIDKLYSSSYKENIRTRTGRAGLVYSFFCPIF